MRKIIILLGISLFSSASFGQRYEYVYRNPADSSFNCYLKVFPETGKIKGLVIRDYSTLPDTTKGSPFRFRDLCSEEGFLTIYTVSSNIFPELFYSDSVISILDEMVAEVIREHDIPPENIFIGGISASGTRALRYAQYCEQGKSRHNIKINGAFAVDSPLDLARFYRSAYNHKENFKEDMLWEANHMSELFPKLFSGSPDEFEDEFIKASVFSHNDSLGGNARFLKNVDIDCHLS